MGGAVRKRERDKDKDRDRETDRQTDGQTDRDKQTDRPAQRDRRTDFRPDAENPNQTTDITLRCTYATSILRTSVSNAPKPTMIHRTHGVTTATVLGV